MSSGRKPPEICPQCGALVPPHALACPECGSDYETGWSDRAIAQRLGLPDDEFDYEDFVRRELDAEPPQPRFRPAGVGWVWWVVALGLVGLLVSWLMGWLQ